MVDAMVDTMVVGMLTRQEDGLKQRARGRRRKKVMGKFGNKGERGGVRMGRGEGLGER